MQTFSCFERLVVPVRGVTLQVVGQLLFDLVVDLPSLQLLLFSARKNVSFAHLFEYRGCLPWLALQCVPSTEVVPLALTVGLSQLLVSS
jgi:hypothetical protein